MDEMTFLQTMGEALISRGLATPEQLASDKASLEARLNGTEVPAEPAQANPTPGGPASAQSGESEETALDRASIAAFQGPESPDAYHFDPVYGQEPNLEGQKALREFFFAEGVPVSIAKEIDRQAMRANQNPPTPQQAEQAEQRNMEMLSRIWGPDRDANLAIARREIDRIEAGRPGIKALLEKTGLGNSAWLAQTVVNLAKAKGREK